MSADEPLYECQCACGWTGWRFREGGLCSSCGARVTPSPDAVCGSRPTVPQPSTRYREIQEEQYRTMRDLKLNTGEMIR